MSITRFIFIGGGFFYFLFFYELHLLFAEPIFISLGITSLILAFIFLFGAIFPNSDKESYSRYCGFLDDDDNDNTDVVRYNDTMISFALERNADYIYEDGLRGWTWVDYEGISHIHWINFSDS